MHIAIIVYSKTGNTLYVAEKMKEKLLKSGHQVTLERLEAINEDENDVSKIVLCQDIKDYHADAYIFGAPVHGFMLSSVMQAFLKDFAFLTDKPVLYYVTQFFPFAWMGGKSAIKQFSNELTSKNAKLVAYHDINWSTKKKRAKQIEDAIKSIDLLLK